jgi:hypothetical protein
MAKQTRKKKKSGKELRHWDVTASRPLSPDPKRAGQFLDSLDVQISVTAKVPRNIEIASSVIEEVIRYRAKHGRNPQGFSVNIIRWRNPDRKAGMLSEVYTNPDDAKGQKGWRKYGPQKERFATLGRALRGTRMVFKITVRWSAGRKARSTPVTNRRRRKKKHKKNKADRVSRGVKNHRPKT